MTVLLLLLVRLSLRPHSAVPKKSLTGAEDKPRLFRGAINVVSSGRIRRWRYRQSSRVQYALEKCADHNALQAH